MRILVAIFMHSRAAYPVLVIDYEIVFGMFSLFPVCITKIAGLQHHFEI